MGGGKIHSGHCGAVLSEGQRFVTDRAGQLEHPTVLHVPHGGDLVRGEGAAAVEEERDRLAVAMGARRSQYSRFWLTTSGSDTVVTVLLAGAVPIDVLS